VDTLLNIFSMLVDKPLPRMTPLQYDVGVSDPARVTGRG
jgi:hypothetical protein